MKKYLVLYSFLNFIFNAIVTIIFRSTIFEDISCLKYGRFHGIGNPKISTRIDDGLESIFLLRDYELSKH